MQMYEKMLIKNKMYRIC